MVFKGGIDCSANPNYPAADAGWTYKVTVAGKIGGASGITVEVGDTLMCTVDATASGTQAGVGANWIILQTNLDQATTSVKGIVALATSTEAEAKADTNKAITSSSLTNFAVKKTFTIGDGTSTSIACTHNLGTQNVNVTIRRVSDNAQVMATVVFTSTTVATVTFSVAPASNSYVVTIEG